MIVLGAAKHFGRVAGEEPGLGAAGEDERAVGSAPFADPRAGDPHQAARAQNHDLAGLVESRPDQGDEEGLAGTAGAGALMLAKKRDDPFGAGAGLAEAPAAHHHAGRPAGTGGHALAVMRPGRPVAVEAVRLLLAEQSQSLLAVLRGEAKEESGDVGVARKQDRAAPAAVGSGLR
jgi:hypothetical protein